MVPLSLIESVISSLLVVLIRIVLKETTCVVPPGFSHCLSHLRWASSYSQPGRGGGGGGGGKLDIEKKIEQVTKIKSDQRLKFSSPQ